MRRWGFAAIMACAMLLGIAAIVVSVMSRFWGHEVTRETVRDLGEALVIGSFIAVTVDQYVKRKLLWETSHDIAKYLIGYNLPKEIQDAIRDLMATAVIRRDFNQHYTLEHNTEGKLKLTISTKYKVLNCSNTVREFTPRLEFEKHQAPTILEFRCDSADRRAVDIKRGNQDLGEKQDGVLSIALKKIKLQPAINGNGLSYQVSCKYYRLVDVADSDVISFVAPTIGVTITAEPPEDIGFYVGTATVETENRWEFQRLFLELQHVHVRWFGKK